MNENEQTIVVKAVDKASSVFKDVGSQFKEMTASFAIGNLAAQAVQKGFDMVKQVVSESINEYRESAQASAQMSAVLESTGHAAGMAKGELVELANSLAGVTRFEDDAIMSAENLLLTFTNIGKDVFPAATKAMLDMSQSLGQDLKSSAIQLGKALNDPIEGVTALKRVGVNFNESQRAIIETLVKSGKTLDAQKMILKELKTEFGGSAEASWRAADSFEKLAKQGKAIEEVIGHGITEAFDDLADSFVYGSDGVADFNVAGRELYRWLSAIGIVIDTVVTAVTSAVRGILGLGSAIAGVVADITGFGEAADSLFNFSTDMGVQAIDSFNGLGNHILTASNKTANWGKESEEAGIKAGVALGGAGVAAEKASEKIASAAKAVARAKQQMDDLVNKTSESVLSEREKIGKAIVEQENKVSDLRIQIADSDDIKEINRLTQQMNREQAALDKKKYLYTNFAAEIAEEKRRDALTGFEREIEDAIKRATILNKEFNEKKLRIQEEIKEAQVKYAKIATEEGKLTTVVKTESNNRTKTVVDENNRQIESYNRVAEAAQRASQRTSITSIGGISSMPNSSAMILTKREHGGLVPGAMGQAVPIIAHGGERIIPAGQNSGRNNSGITVTFNNVTIGGGSRDEIESSMTELLNSYFRPTLERLKMT